MNKNREAKKAKGLEGTMAALRRAAQRARLIALRTGTPLVLGRGGRVEKRWPEAEGTALREAPPPYVPGPSDEMDSSQGRPD